MLTEDLPDRFETFDVERELLVVGQVVGAGPHAGGEAGDAQIRGQLDEIGQEFEIALVLGFVEHGDRQSGESWRNSMLEKIADYLLAIFSNPTREFDQIDLNAIKSVPGGQTHNFGNREATDTDRPRAKGLLHDYCSCY
jgi:hypothetical protein